MYNSLNSLLHCVYFLSTLFEQLKYGSAVQITIKHRVEHCSSLASTRLTSKVPWLTRDGSFLNQHVLPLGAFVSRCKDHDFEE